MPLETITLSEISTSILDPFSDEFLGKVAEVNERLAAIEENPINTLKIKKKRVITPRFYLDKLLIKRLEKLKKSTEDSDVISIIDALLTKERQENSSINYLGLSRDDFSKISYMDTARIDRFKDETFTKSYFKSGSVVTIRRILRRYNPSTREHYEIGQNSVLKVTASRLAGPVVCQKSEDGFYVIPEDARIHFYSRTLSGYVQNRILQDGRNVINFNNSLYNALSSTLEIELTDVTQSMLWNPDRRYHSSVGKVIRKIFGNQFNDNAICKFAEQYFQLIVVNDNNYDLIFAEGQDIRKYYHENSYLPQNSSQLWNSCMRYDRCQNYFRMYEENPNCKLAVLLYKPKSSSTAGVAARALIWTNSNGTYIDRIYFYNSKAEAIIKNQLTSIGYKNMRDSRVGYHDGSPIEIDAPIMEDLIIEDANFPYVDTLRYYDVDRKVLTAECPPNNKYASFSQTGGSYDSRNVDFAMANSRCSCSNCAREEDEENMYYVELGRSSGDYLCGDCAIWIEGRDVYVNQRDAVFDISGDFIYYGDSVSLCNGMFMHDNDENLAEYENNYGYFALHNDNFEYSEIDGCYYHPNDPYLATLIEEKERELAEEALTRYNEMEEEEESANYQEMAKESVETEEVESQITTQIEQINETNHETNQSTNTPTYGEFISCATSNTTSITINTNGSVNLLDIL